MSGFKSFAKRSDFVFDERISAVVGPNGSGKSNLVEAIRFVLGEQSNKSLRSRQTSDLIFKGSDKVKKSNRAEVSIVFDNKDRAFKFHNDDNSVLELGFDEITISRTVHDDGGSEYKINDSSVRLRDVHELIASVNIGTSNHHIISQGQADRVLSASPRERREMIEDALGLKIYQFRIKEAQKKLEKTAQNLREIELQQKELLPYLKHLEKEVEQIENAKKIRKELDAEYKEYLAQENACLKKEENDYLTQQTDVNKRVEELESLKKSNQELVDGFTNHEARKKLAEVKASLAKKDNDIVVASRSIGKIEGNLVTIKETLMSFESKQETLENNNEKSKVVEASEVRGLTDKLMARVQKLELENSLASLHMGLADIRKLVDSFWHRVSDKKENQKEDSSLGLIIKLKSQLAQAEQDLENMSKEHLGHQEDKKNIENKVSILQEEIKEKEKERYEAEKELIKLESELRNLETKKDFLERSKIAITSRKDRFLSELEEATVLLGQGVKKFNLTIPESILSEVELSKMKNRIERKKIALESMGSGGGGEVLKDYEEAKERSDFLTREINDIHTTSKRLTQLKKELEGIISKSFSSGIDQISKAFHGFFVAMFGGGRAHLETSLISGRKNNGNEGDSPGGDDFGIGIKVKLPEKKVTEIDMLSGGERSLTSIAFLFALSQVNPPPFLVLDETDAALDEANSKRYGDMLEKLSEVAQLIIVTHNRETMSRAQNLYGVTMSADGASQVLSIKLEEALKTAK